MQTVSLYIDSMLYLVRLEELFFSPQIPLTAPSLSMRVRPRLHFGRRRYRYNHSTRLALPTYRYRPILYMSIIIISLFHYSKYNV